MKRLGWGVLAFMIGVLIVASPSVRAIDTVPTTPNKTTSPLLITGYSFTGSTLRYVQIFNSSTALVSLDGWQVASGTKTTPIVPTTYVTLSGLLEPGKHILASGPGLIDSPAFVLPIGEVAGTALVGNVSLVAPSQSGFNDETVIVPTVTSSTPKETVGAQLNYYVRRDISLTTGNYLTGMVFFVLSERLKNDNLYVAPSNTFIEIIEVYPDAPNCSPSAGELTCADYVKIRNASTTAIDLSQLRLRTGQYGQTATSSNTKALAGVLQSGEYASFPLSLSSSGSWVWLEDVYGTVRYDPTMVQFPSSEDNDNEAWAYDEKAGDWRWTQTPSPGNMQNRFPEEPEVNACSSLRVSEIAANVASEDQFIEIMNTSTAPADLAGCIIQTNRSTTNEHVFGASVLLPESYVTVYVKDTNLTLTKTTTGSVYIMASDRATEVDVVPYENLAEGTSFALVDGEWRPTYLQTPGVANVLLEQQPCPSGSIRNADTELCNKMQASTSSLVDCGEGKVRNSETNRCRAVDQATATLAACASDQYRSPDTNRCRSILTAASVLAPCAANQERNPLTNRCKVISDDISTLKPCATNQERNPDTNRCRNKSDSIKADFPVETVAQTGEATVGWWAFGGAGTLAAGYAGWEWRREVLSWIRKVSPLGIGRR